MAHETSNHGHGHAPRHPAEEVIKHPTAALYWQTYAGLVFLLVVTVALYYFDISKALGWIGWNLIVAMFVAIIKATLVVRNFMNVKGSTKLTVFWAVIGFVWLIFMFGIFLDYQQRHLTSPPGWLKLEHQLTLK